MKALDNGGRFYNIFTSAGDDVVTSAELKKAAGVIGSDQCAYLFFAMALHDLGDSQRRMVEARLDKGVRDGLRRLSPAVVSPKEVASLRATKACIIEGYPRQVPDHKVHGTMMMPITTMIIRTRRFAASRWAHSCPVRSAVRHRPSPWTTCEHSVSAVAELLVTA